MSKWRRPSGVSRPTQLMTLRRESGFTLVEALAAFTILSLVLIALLEGISIATRGDFRAELLRTAMRLAKSKLETIGASVPLEVGVSSGKFDNGLEWAISIRPYPGLSVNNAPSAYWIEIAVLRPVTGNSFFPQSSDWQPGRQVVLTLTTLRLDDRYQ